MSQRIEGTSWSCRRIGCGVAVSDGIIGSSGASERGQTMQRFQLAPVAIILSDSLTFRLGRPA